jgi:hypothetical protein
MKVKYALLAVSMLCLGLAACSESALLSPESPRFDGGGGFGSGNRLMQTDSATTPSTTPTSGTTADGGSSTARGGGGFGSGN